MSLTLLSAPLRARGQALLDRLDRLPARERSLLVVGALALLVGLEMMVVWPMHGQRQTVVDAASAQAQSEADAAAQAAGAQAQALAELQTRLATIERDLKGLGAGKASGEPMGFLLSRTLRAQGVQMLSMRELAVEELDTAPAAAAGPDMVAGAVAAGPAHPPLFRHRWELSFSGEVGALRAAVQSLDDGLRPLRIERVRIGSRDGRAVEATVTLVVIGMERTWLSI